MIIDQLVEALGSNIKVAKALEVGRMYPGRWRREGYIPEVHALAVERLQVRNRGTLITAYDVLLEAERVRAANIAASIKAMEEMNRGD